MRYQIKFENGVQVIRILESNFNLGVVQKFNDLMTRQIQRGLSRIVLDLRYIDILDSCGLGVFLFSFKRLKPKGNLAVCGLNSELLKQFELAHLDREIPVFNTTAQAVQGIAVSPFQVNGFVN